MAANWIDLLDPTEEELRRAAPVELEESALELLLAVPEHDDEPRPTVGSHRGYIFAILLDAVASPNEDSVFYQEIDLVITHETIVTVRKTPPNGKPPYDLTGPRENVGDDDSPGMIAYRIFDDIAECYLDLVDDLDAEIDELEDRVDAQPLQVSRARVSQLRHDLLHIRRTLAPMRDAVRRVAMNEIEIRDGTPVFPQEVEIAFNAAYDKFLRALDGLELSRDLLASVRDYAQAKIAIDQNEVTKRLTVIASLVLIPTFIVGVYGQNFLHMPELHWRHGYAFSWALIVGTTLVQLWFFRRKKWL
jgi:magnesium transporter